MPLFLIRSVAADGVADIDDPDLDERHWAYTDPHAASMIARGPTLDATRSEWTGSIHILDLPDLPAARRYIDHEPYHCAGAYREHRVWRFDDALGRTMHDTIRVDEQLRYFVLVEDRQLTAAHLASDLPTAIDAQLVALGDITDPATHTAHGIALAVQVPARLDLDAVLARLGLATADGHGVEIIDWEFGGRR